jgi:hypothetical protein
MMSSMMVMFMAMLLSTMHCSTAKMLLQTSTELASEGWEYEFYGAFIEVYNESIRDLLRYAPASCTC